MSLMDILQQYTGRPTDTHEDFDAVSREVPTDVLGAGLAQAFRSDRTPPFGQMVGQLFGGSNPQQRSGLLEQLMRSVGPAVLSSVAGGALGRLVGGAGSSPGTSASGSPIGAATTTGQPPIDASQLTPQQVEDLANEAEKHDPGVLDKVGSFYAQHPQAVKALGGAALAIALGQMAERMKR